MRGTESTHSSGSNATAFKVVARILAVGTRPLWLLAEYGMNGYDRWRQRQALMRLDDHLLKDIGVSRADVEEEARKPFWRS